MVTPPFPADEADRLHDLEQYQVLDTASEADFDDIARLASHICCTPIAAITFVDANRQWFKAKVGLSADQTPREPAFCAHAILSHELLVVPNALEDERFHDNPFVTGNPHIRFYAGAPLVSPQGYTLGTLCVIDRTPRQLTAEQSDALRALSRQVVNQLTLRRTVMALKTSERFARSTVDALTSHIAILDERGHIIAVNRAWRDFAERNPPVPSAFALGANYLAVCESASGPCSEEAYAVAKGIRAVLSGDRDVFTIEYPCHSPTEKRWFMARVSRFADEGPTRVVVSHDNITARRQAEDRLRHDSLHDALTGLPNRVLFTDRVSHTLHRAKRDPARHFAVLFIDLDRFKIVNDSLGHAAGDVLLTTIAERLRRCLRSADSVGLDGNWNDIEDGEHAVARMGGDEFTILLDELRAPEDAARVAERVLAAVSRPVDFGGQDLTTTASIGIANGNSAYQSSRELVRDADAAMYQAKSAGKNQYVIFDATMHVAALTRLRLESDLRHAIDRGEMLLHYQPIISLRTGGLEGFEALIRWKRGDTMVSPAEFIPLAEDTGLIVPMGLWVLESACRQMKSWQQAWPAARGHSMSVNVSGRQLADPLFSRHVERILKETGLPPGALTLEITESMLVRDTEATMELLSRIKATGVRLGMDDFGTGYSSLSYLNKFSLDILKVDRSFFSDVHAGRNASAVVQAIITLAHDLGMRVVAEGLETREQIAFVQALHCDMGQGYHFSRPVPSELAGKFLAEGCRVLCTAA